MAKRMIVSLLAILTFVAFLTACSDNADDTSADATTLTESPMTASTTETEVSDDLPELDFGGTDFSILLRTDQKREFITEAEGAEVIGAAVYKRNLEIEERFNVLFKYTDIAGLWGDGNSFLNYVRKSVAAGDDEFDLIAGYAAYIVNLGGDDLLNLNTLGYLDSDKPWWNEDIVRELNINGKRYFISGDLAISALSNAICLMFNKGLWDDYNLEDPYALVKTGAWTFDKMAELTKNVSADVNNDGVYGTDDLYGYVTDSHNFIDAYQTAFDVPVTVTGSDSYPVLAVKEQKFSDAYVKLYGFMRETPSTFAGIDQTSSADNIYRPLIFDQGRGLIVAECMGNTELMRELDFDFGILPYPKYNENQANYKTLSLLTLSLFCVPKTAVQTEMIGAVMEALAAGSYQYVTPAFYEVALKTKYSRDEDSAEMMDIIRKGITYNFGMVYCVPLNGAMHSWRLQLIANNINIVSSVEKSYNQYEAGLKKVLEIYSEG